MASPLAGNLRAAPVPSLSSRELGAFGGVIFEKSESQAYREKKINEASGDAAGFNQIEAEYWKATER